MRVRIIFRGLVLFQFERSREESSGLPHRGRLRAWLIGGADSKHPPGDLRHVHTPTMGIIGRVARRRGTKTLEILDLKSGLNRGATTISLAGAADGVSPSLAFDEHVPRLTTMYDEPPSAPKHSVSPTWIDVPHGTIRSRDLVSWDFEGNRPIEVAFMSTKYRGFVANEAVVDIGDDNDYEDDDDNRVATIASTTDLLRYLPTDPVIRRELLPSGAKRLEELALWPLTKGNAYRDETDPNTLEILITNFAPQRRRSVFWSLHYQWLFAASGFGNKRFTDSAEFKAFKASALAYDRTEWAIDSMVRIDKPFPYLVTDGAVDAKGLEKHWFGYKCARPPESGGGRGPHDGIIEPRARRTVMMPAGDIGAGTDPWARPICPLGQFD